MNGMVERDERRDREVTAFGPVFSLSIVVQGPDPLLVQSPAATADGPAQVLENDESQSARSEGLDALTPSQQAVLKMMSSPPRSQDPLGVMADVEQNLAGAEGESPINTKARGEQSSRQGASPLDHNRAADRSRFTQEEQITDSGLRDARLAGQQMDAESRRGEGLTAQASARNTAVPQTSGMPSPMQSGPGSAVAGMTMLGMRAAAGGQVSVQQVSASSAPSASLSAEANGTGTVSAVAIGGLSGAARGGARGDSGIGEMSRDTAAKGAEGPEAEKVQAQALRGLAAALRKKGDAVTVVLRPEALGKLRIDLRFDGDVVRGRLTCSTESARDLLVQSVETLARAMESRGLAVDRLEVVHDPGLDPHTEPGRDGARSGAESPGWGTAGEQSNPRWDAHAGGTGESGRGGAEFSGRDMSDGFGEAADVLVHDPAFHWDGRRMALSTLA